MMHVQKNKRTWLGALTALVLAACSVACSNSAPTGPAPATDVETLTFPVTITLSTPSPLSPVGAVLEGSNSVQLGARASVLSGTTVSLGTGGLQMQPDVVFLDTWSRGTAVLNDRVKIQGTLHAKTKTQGANVSITTWDSAPAIDPVQKLSWKVVYPAGTELRGRIPRQPGHWRRARDLRVGRRKLEHAVRERGQVLRTRLHDLQRGRRAPAQRAARSGELPQQHHEPLRQLPGCGFHGSRRRRERTRAVPEQ